VRRVIEEARLLGYEIEDSKNGPQIDFGCKKLHEKHLRKLFPIIGVSIKDAIEQVAPGRPCVHVPMREIIRRLRVSVARGIYADSRRLQTCVDDAVQCSGS
jgi:bifunctional DNase/RNase